MFSFRSLLKKLAEQKNTSPHLGALISSYSATAILYAPLTLLGVATTVYGLWGRDLIQQWFPWFTFPVMVISIILFMLVMMVLFYKVVIPSSIAFGVQQNYKHRNPLVADVQKVLKNDEMILKELKDIKDRLGNLEKK